MKIKRQDLLPDGKNISDLIAYLQDYILICLIFPCASQLALIGYLQARAKSKCF